jgi:serine/threonine-protein kinase
MSSTTGGKPWPAEKAAERLPSPGEIVDGKYLVEQVLGSGGMATVVSAIHIVRRARVALKFLKMEMLDVESSAARLIREGVAASSVPSEHVVKILDAGHLPSGVPYLVMELLDGCDLAILLRDEGTPGLPVPRAIHFVLQILRALQAAHAHGIVHRDLKPSNCFVTKQEGERDFIKLLDFGVSKMVNPSEAALTRAGAALGTFAYMAPEQALSSKDADSRCDLYSVGVVLYRLLSGHLPFKRTKGLATTALAQFEGRATPIEEYLPDLDPALIAAVHKAFARDPAQRFPSAAAMADALGQWADDRSVAVLHRIRQLERASNRPTSSPALTELDNYALERSEAPTYVGASLSDAKVQVLATAAPSHPRSDTGAPSEVVASVVRPARSRPVAKGTPVVLPIVVLVALFAVTYAIVRFLGH